MSAIYQKARPIHWDEVVGQEHVRDVLEAALQKGKIGHAYLFSGPRGVGKTTTARLIAMTANCEAQGVPRPCGVCASCQQVIAGSHPDVFEIDAASNNSVDDVRELREKVGLSSMYGGKKVYILDEAHMMTKSAFNALLKTLEEPPEHVVFILATTEPERILPTILSRCQHYRFRRLSEVEVAGKLERILEAESVPFESEALLLIGRLADGAMRDGESLLERMLASGEAVTLRAVEDALGLPPAQRMATLSRGLLERDFETVLRSAGELYRDGFAARSVVDGVKTALRQMLHAALGLGGEKVDPGASSGALLKLLAALDEQDARFVRSSDSLALEMALTQAMLGLDGGQTSESGGQRAEAGSSSADPALMQRVNRLERELADLKTRGVSTPTPAPSSPEPRAPSPAPLPTPHSPLPSPVLADLPPQPAPRAAPAAPRGTWNDVLRLADAKTRAFLKPARAESDGGYLTLTFDERSKFHAQQVINKFDDLLALVERAMGPLVVEIITPEGRKKKPSSGLSSGRPAEEPHPPLEGTGGSSPTLTPVPAGPPVRAAQPLDPARASAARPEGPVPTPARAQQSARAFFEDGPRAPAPQGPAAVMPGSAPALERAIVTPQAPEPPPQAGEPLPWEDPSSPPLHASPQMLEPLDAPPVFDSPPLESWDALGEDPVREPARRPNRNAVSVEQHPLYPQVRELFRHQVRSRGKLKTAPSPEDEVASGEVASGEDQSAVSEA